MLANSFSLSHLQILYMHIAKKSPPYLSRFVGYELYSVNQTFKDTVEAMVNIMAPNATYTASYRPGVEAPIYGPDGINGTGSALAPTPGTGMWQNQKVPANMSLPLY